MGCRQVSTCYRVIKMKQISCRMMYTAISMVQFSKLGAGVFSYALLIYWSTSNGQYSKSGIILGLYYWAKVFLGPVSGTIADRVKNKQKLLFLNEVVCGALYTLLLLVNPDGWALFSMVCGIVLAEVFFNKISTAALDNLLRLPGMEEAQRKQCISYDITLDRCVGVLAPLFGAAILQYVGLRGVIFYNVISYFPTCLFMLFWMLSHREPFEIKNEVPSKKIETPHFLKNYLNGLQCLSRQPIIRNSMVLIIFLNGIWGVVPLFLSTAIISTGHNELFGMCLASINVGAILVGVLATRKIVPLLENRGPLLIAYLFYCGACVLAAILNGSLIAVIAFLVSGGLGTWIGISLQSSVVLQAPVQRVGAVNSTISSIGNLSTPIWLFLYALFLPRVGSVDAFVIVVMPSFAISCYMAGILLFNTKKRKRVICEIS